MAAVAAKATGTATKMKKPPAPVLQTNTNGTKPAAPSSSPSSARKTLPGQSQNAPSAASNSAAVNGTARPNRRLQRLNTRNSTTDTLGSDKRGTKKFPEPYVPKESHILRKFKGSSPSLIVHLHPTHFRFDQQEGSFSYHSEMRIFIDHLAKGTIPHDMVEEFRKSDVKYYDGWLIVRVLDYKSVAKDAAANDAGNGDEKPFSIHNYNQYITPSPYVPYPTKEQSVARSPPTKQERRDSISGELKDTLSSDDTIDVAPKSTKPKPKIYHVALRPTVLSKHMDMVIDAMTPDPKSVNRKQSQANSSNRAPGSGAPQTPISGVPSTPSTDKGPPHKKLKLKIDPKDLLDYEARIVNATAPPLYLDAVESIEEAETLMDMLRDPYHDARPPSPISRKRTVAELAADDAHAKEQEKFMLIMDERTSGASGAPNAGAVDGQAASALFQPRFEKFNALDNIKREIAERKQREKDRQLQEDENRRGQQERLQEEEKKRILMQRAQEARAIRARQQEMQAALAAQQQTAQTNQRPPSQQMNGIPPNMQNQIMAAQQQRGSPILRQGTPHAASSPVVTNATAQGGLPMAVSGSQQGNGSPARPGSAVQHAHPTAPMARVGSGQALSRNGTPQLPHGTPAGGNATPIMRQGTPGQHISQASPHSSMAAPTPQMMPNGMLQGMQGQMPNGVPRQPNPQQLAEMQRRHAMQQQAAAQQAAMHQQMINGTPQMAQAQMAHMQAQHHAQMDRQAAMQRQQAQQQAMQQGTPQSQHMSPVPAQSQKAYNQSVADHVKAQMQSLQQPHSQGSPGQNQMTPQQQAAQMAQAQQQQRIMAAQAQGQMMGGNGPQQRPQISPQLQALYQNTLSAYTQRFLTQAASKYGGNTNMLQPAELQQVQGQAKQAAMTAVRKRQAEMSQMNQMQMHAQMRQQTQQGGGGMNMNGGGMGMNVNPNMAAALQQHQAQQMQQMQMQHAQQMMAQQQQQHQQQQQQQQQQQGMQFQHQRG